jgi:hypothetical protein
MSRNDKYATSEAKNASFNVRFGTRAFLASETSDIFSIPAPSAFLHSGAEQSLAEPTAIRVAQLIAGADSFAAAQFKR